MRDSRENSKTAADREIPLDTRLLSEAVIELNISRKNVGIYPRHHIQITKSIDRTFDLLTRLFELRPEMTLGVAKDTLLVGQDYLDKKNPVYRDMALSMSQRGIAAVTFVSGMEREELVQFHRILTTKPEDVRSSGGMEAAITAAGIRHIRIVPIDYSSFNVTEEAEIVRSQNPPVRSSDSGVWQDFVSLLSSGGLAGPGEGVSLKDAEKIDPAELARLLNERKLDTNAAVQSYDRIISEYVRGSAEKKQVTREQSKALANLNKLLQGLHPELRKQFLSVAFERASSGSSGNAEQIIGGLADDMVIEMLSQASAEGREISPTLAGLVGKLANTETGRSVSGPDRNQVTGGSAVISATASPEQMQKLFDREKYEEYVSADYEAMLKRMAESPAAANEQFPLAEYAKSLEDSHLDFQIGRALLAFMEENLEEDDYREFAAKLITIVPGFLETGNFELLVDISETLRRHATEISVPGIRSIAEESRKIFTDPDFIIKALKAFEIWLRDKGQEAAGLIQSLGPDTVPGLMDIFSRDEAPGGRRVLFNLLCLFGEPAIREAHKRLGDPRAYFVRNLLIFIRRSGSPSSIPHVKPLLHHQDQTIKMEALSTLLKFKDPGAVKILREWIRSNDPDIASRAIALAGQHRVAPAVEDILSRIKTVILFDADYQWNEEIIRALGEIGDPRSLPELEQLARSSWSLYPKSQMQMKECLYESLRRYPQELIARLLTIGQRLDSDKIKRTCKKLAERS